MLRSRVSAAVVGGAVEAVKEGVVAETVGMAKEAAAARAVWAGGEASAAMVEKAVATAAWGVSAGAAEREEEAQTWALCFQSG